MGLVSVVGLEDVEPIELPHGSWSRMLVTPERVSRLSRGSADGADAGNAIEQLVRATVASFQAPTLDLPAPSLRRSATPNKT